MAQFSLTIIGAAGGAFGDMVTAFDVSDDDSDRILAYVMARFGEDAEGNARTPQEAAAAYCAHVMRWTMAQVRSHEADVAANAARDAVPPIPFTPVP